MKKILFTLLAMILLGTSVFAQSGNRRGTPEKKTQTSIERPTPAVAPTVSTAAADEDGEMVKIDTAMVTIPVSVIDRSGRSIAGLTIKDFELYEDNQPQKIEMFSTFDQPFSVVLVLDVSLSTKFKITEIQNAANMLVNQLRPEDKVLVLSFDQQAHILSEFSSDRAQLQRAIRTARFATAPAFMTRSIW